MPFYENNQSPERALLLGVDTGEYDCEVSLAELEELSRTAGAQVVGTVSQKLPNPNPATYIGSGRMEEVCAFCRANEIDLIVADGELSPAQQRNMETQTDTRVIDRTTLILDIFAQRARSREGKIQVELAQLRYMLPRLTGKGKAMSRLGGGIGTRGRARASWKATSAISAVGFMRWKRNCGKSKNGAMRCARAAKKTASLPWRLSAIQMRANPR